MAHYEWGRPNGKIYSVFIATVAAAVITGGVGRVGTVCILLYTSIRRIGIQHDSNDNILIRTKNEGKNEREEERKIRRNIMTRVGRKCRHPHAHTHKRISLYDCCSSHYIRLRVMR